MKKATLSPSPQTRQQRSKRSQAPQLPAASENNPDGLAQANLMDEVHSLRLMMRRVECLAAEECSLTDLLLVLDGLGKASTRVATLLKTQQVLTKEDDFGGTFNQVLAEVIREMEIKGPF
jgi:hypothetical protein